MATLPPNGEVLGNSTVWDSQQAGYRAFAVNLAADYAATEARSSATGDLLCSEERYRDVVRSTRAADTVHKKDVAAREDQLFRLRAQHEKAERQAQYPRRRVQAHEAKYTVVNAEKQRVTASGAVKRKAARTDVVYQRGVVANLSRSPSPPAEEHKSCFSNRPPGRAPTPGIAYTAPSGPPPTLPNLPPLPVSYSNSSQSPSSTLAHPHSAETTASDQERQWAEYRRRSMASPGLPLKSNQLPTTYRQP